jgi:hypothetical protein
MHFPGHLRQALCDWIEQGAPDVATVEVDYEPVQGPAERLLGRDGALHGHHPRRRLRRGRGPTPRLRHVGGSTAMAASDSEN